jgi:hypothetical protein
LDIHPLKGIGDIEVKNYGANRSDTLKLYESRIGSIELVNGVARFYFSHANVIRSKGKPPKDSGIRWIQEAELLSRPSKV